MADGVACRSADIIYSLLLLWEAHAAMICRRVSAITKPQITVGGSTFLKKCDTYSFPENHLDTLVRMVLT